MKKKELLTALSAELGEQHVASEGAPQLAYARKRFSHFLRDRSLVALAQLDGIESLQKVLELARTHQVTLWTQARPHDTSGIAAPAKKDVVLLDLSRMNRVVEVDRLNATALLEPGVTYLQLAQYLQDNKIPFWLDCTRNPDDSVVSTIASRAYGFTPYGDRTLMQCGTEVLMPDGLLVRTGMGAMPKSNMFQLFKWGYGPVVDGLFMQSNLGIITKLGTWLMPEPPAAVAFHVALPDEAALAAAIEAVRPLKVNMIVPNTVAISTSDYERSYVHSDRKASDSLGPWNLFGAVYGLPANVAFLWEVVQQTLGTIPGAKLENIEDAAEDALLTRRHLMFGRPDQLLARKEPPKAENRIRIAAVGPITAADVGQMTSLARTALREANLPPLLEVSLGWRMALVAAEIPFDLDRAKSLASARKTAASLMTAWAKAGYTPTHAPADELPEAMQHLSSVFVSTIDKLKNSIDPYGIIAN